MKPLFPHQEETAQFAYEHNMVLNTSDPGTGKTRATLEGYFRRKQDGIAKRLLVVAPLSILRPAWGDDIAQFFPTLRYDTAERPEKNRIRAFKGGADVVIINVDAIKWVRDNQELLENFTDICIDEFTHFKNQGSQRSRAALDVCQRFAHRTLLSGTPNPNSLTDLWHPMRMLDGGERLGRSFYKFRNSVCFPEQSGPRPEHVKWVSRPDMSPVVSASIADVSLRYILEECVDIPAHSQHTMFVDMSPRIMKAYRSMEADSVVLSTGGNVSAINKAVRVNKMLQILSGAVYGEEGVAITIDNTRCELVMELVEERDHSVVAFNWQHEKEGLLAEAKKRRLVVGVIDGKTPQKIREATVRAFQAGDLQAVLCHPAAAAHGLTLTRGRTTIWASATYNSEHFLQLNRRIYRAGQDKKTETIMVCARDSREEKVYEVLENKIEGVDMLQALIGGLNEHSRA
jgi:SNF2 family DNA or RNA helicase